MTFEPIATKAPRRRGRPPASEQAQPAAPAMTEAAPKRRRRASVGGAALKLSAPPREGFTRRWVNDENNRIATAGELGYDHVTDKSIQSSGSDTRISRLVGTKPNGAELRAYLMETPNELYAEGVFEREQHNRMVDEAITAGRDSTGQMNSSESYGQGSIQRDR